MGEMLVPAPDIFPQVYKNGLAGICLYIHLEEKLIPYTVLVQVIQLVKDGMPVGLLPELVPPLKAK